MTGRCHIVHDRKVSPLIEAFPQGNDAAVKKPTQQKTNPEYEYATKNIRASENAKKQS